MAYIALQNVRVWGDVSTLSLSDKNGTAIHEAWAEAYLSNQFSLKFGRQEIVYDNQRMFGNVGWAQQARSHDAFIATYKPDQNNRLDIGFALNENAETIFDSDYTVNNYKAFQYLWYHTNFGAVSLSFLVLNNGLVYDDNGVQKLNYNQTFGSFATFGKSKLKADASVYFQTGKVAGTDLSAYNFTLNIHYALTDRFNIGLGAEYLSGTDMNSTEAKLKSFTPWFGTNHKFNGWMDYFYVGNHANSVGLLDINGTVAYNNNRFSAKLVPHIFSSAATVVDGSNAKMNNALGTELDWVVAYQWTKDVTFNLGYSQMFATKTMEILKPGNKDNSNNWAWAMITVKPSLFKTAFKKAD
jgi:hypothetical protein